MSVAILFPLLGLPSGVSSDGLFFTRSILVQCGLVASEETLGLFWLSRALLLIPCELKYKFNSEVNAKEIMLIRFVFAWMSSVDACGRNSGLVEFPSLVRFSGESNTCKTTPISLR